MGAPLVDEMSGVHCREATTRQQNCIIFSDFQAFFKL